MPTKKTANKTTAGKARKDTAVNREDILGKAEQPKTLASAYKIEGLKDHGQKSDLDCSTLKFGTSSLSADVTINAVDSSARMAQSEKGAANRAATLDGTGKVPASQLPSYLDDVLEYANFASLPATGEAGKIYVTLDTGFFYRWTDSAYVSILSKAEQPEASSAAYTTEGLTDHSEKSYPAGSTAMFDSSVFSNGSLITRVHVSSSKIKHEGVNIKGDLSDILENAASQQAAVHSRLLFQENQAVKAARAIGTIQRKNRAIAADHKIHLRLLQALNAVTTVHDRRLDDNIIAFNQVNRRLSDLEADDKRVEAELVRLSQSVNLLVSHLQSSYWYQIKRWISRNVFGNQTPDALDILKEAAKLASNDESKELSMIPFDADNDPAGSGSLNETIHLSQPVSTVTIYGAGSGGPIPAGSGSAKSPEQVKPGLKQRLKGRYQKFKGYFRSKENNNV